MGNRISSALGGSRPNDQEEEARRAAAAASSYHHRWREPYDRQVWSDSITTLKRIMARQQDVNIVISGASGIGTKEYCQEFAKWTHFRFVDQSRAYHSNVEQVEGLRSQTTDRIDQRGQAFIYHMMDALRQGYLHLDEGARRNATPDSSERTELRVFHQNIMDYISAMGQASKTLGYLNDSEMCMLQQVGALLWKLSNVNCAPSNTLYVYIKYSEQVHKAAYGCFLETTERTLRENGATEEERRVFDKTTRAMTPLMDMSKNELDRFYSANVVSEGYFSIIIDCEDRFLLNARYGLTICNKILSVVDALQEQGMWGAPDLVRLRFLAHHDWKLARICHIPVALVIKNNDARELRRDAAEFSASNPPFAVASTALPDPDQPLPRASPRRPSFSSSTVPSNITLVVASAAAAATAPPPGAAHEDDIGRRRVSSAPVLVVNKQLERVRGGGPAPVATGGGGSTSRRSYGTLDGAGDGIRRTNVNLGGTSCSLDDISLDGSK